jgi:hypothetical protein
MRKTLLEALGVLLVVFGLVTIIYTYVFGTLSAAVFQVNGQGAEFPLVIIVSSILFLGAALLPFVGAFLCFRAAAKN